MTAGQKGNSAPGSRIEVGKAIICRGSRIYKAICAVYDIGIVLAMAVSYDYNRSICWAILHSICSWFYVAYHSIFK